MELYCCICLYIRIGVAEDAITVINGHAVCEDHLGVVSSPAVNNAIQLHREGDLS